MGQPTQKNIKNSPASQIAWYQLEVTTVCEKLATSIKTGLTQAEAELRLEAYGANVLPEEQAEKILVLFARQIKSPLVYILIFAGFLSLALQKYIDFSIIFVVILANVGIGFFQERRAQKTLEELKQVLKPQSPVLRDGKIKDILASNLVPGDVIRLSPGDRIPADARVVSANNLEVVESVLTGESVPVLKHAEPLKHQAPIADQDAMVFCGTEVTSGIGFAVVVQTGEGTELGKIAQLLIATQRRPTPLQKNISEFSTLLAWVTAALGFLILVVGLLRHRDFFEMLFTAVAVSVAVIPEGLLISLTVILTVGMQRILKHRGLVRHLSATETLGATSVICTDKTGTLTLGEMRVVSLVTGFAEHHRRKDAPGTGDPATLEILKMALWGSEAIVENPEEDPNNWRVIGNLTERALVIAGAEIGYHKMGIDARHQVKAQLVFSEARKYSAVLRSYTKEHAMLAVKGAAEVILQTAHFVNKSGERVILSDSTKARLQEKLDSMTRQGLRVIGVATCLRPVSEIEIREQDGLPKDLVFEGFIGLRDPLRDEVKDTIQRSLDAGIRIVLITGDHKQTALSIAEEAGMKIVPSQAYEGKDLDGMDDVSLRTAVADAKLFARVTPSHKLRIIKALQERGEVVAMTGDGVNDAPALKRADIGMSLGSGTEVARSASDLVLLDNNVSTIIGAVEQGRIIFNNIRTVIVYLLSDSFSHVILITASLILNLPLPLLPAQILWSNLITDGSPNLALTQEPGDPSLMKEKPRSPHEPLINREMKILILFVGIVTDLVFLLLFLKLRGQFDLALVRTVVFAASGFSSLLYVFSLKSLHKPLWQIPVFNNRWLLASVLLGIMLQLAAIYWGPLQVILQTVPIPLTLWYWVIGLSAIKLLAIEVAKFFFKGRGRALTQ